MLFCLYHDNVKSYAGKPYEVDTKVIGHYSSLQKVLDAKRRYCAVKGFADFPEGFGIRCVLPMDDELKLPVRGDVVFRNGYTYFDVDLALEFSFDGYFYTRQNAEDALSKLCSLPRFSSTTQRLKLIA